MELILCLVVFGIVFLPKLFKEASENEQHRQWCIKNGIDTYCHVDGTWRDTKTNQKLK